MANESATGVADVVSALHRRWLVAVLTAVPLLSGTVGYVQSLPDRYDGEAVVSFTPRPDAVISADTIRVLVQKYVAYLVSRSVAQEVADDLGEDRRGLADAVEATVATDTANLTVVVRLGDAQRASAAANAFADQAVALASTDELLAAEVIAPALPPTDPASPPRTLLLAGGLFFAVAAGVTAAVVVDRSKPRVASAMGLAVATGQGVLGRVPSSRTLRRGAVVDALDDPVVGTAVRALRTQLEPAVRPPRRNVLAVTSASSGDGKTTAATLLAAAFARVGVRVLLVDADLRRPRVSRLLDLPEDRPGLADALEGRPLHEVVQASALPGLDVVGASARDDLGDLLARSLKPVLEEARARYDVVVVDCPPVLATADARTIARDCDGTLVVAAVGTAVDWVVDAVRSLESLDVTVVGTVLNRDRGSQREGVGSYGSYGAQRAAG